MDKGRPIKTRRVLGEPRTSQFSPRGRVGRPGHKDLKVEEFEAIRLIDYAGMDQKQAAKVMKISQQTFSRVLKSARKGLAEAMVKGDIIRIKGGNFKLEA